MPALLDSAVPSQLFGFVLSFTVIAIFWRANYRLIASLRAMDAVTIVANIGAAFFIVLLTFTTQALNAPTTSDRPLPVALYALNIALASLAQSGMFALARHRGLTSSDAEPPERRWARVVGDLLTPAVFLASIVVAYLVSTKACEISWASLFILSPLLRWLGRVGRGAQASTAKVGASPGSAQKPDAK